MGALRRQRGDVVPAIELHRQAIAIFEELEDPRGEAQARANLGEALHAVGEFSGAQGEYETSLALNEALNSPEGIGMNCWQLGRLWLDRGERDKARAFAFRCLRADEAGDRPESIGGGLHLFGQIELSAKEFDAAVDSLSSALDIYRSSGQRLGAAWTAADLARAHAGAGHAGAARSALSVAVDQGSGLEHVQFQSVLSAAQAAVDKLA